MNKRSSSFYFTIFLFLLLICIFLYWLIVWSNQVYTNDAYVQGNQVYIKSLRPGFVTGIYTDDSFLVKKDSLLFH